MENQNFPPPPPGNPNPPPPGIHNPPPPGIHNPPPKNNFMILGGVVVSVAIAVIVFFATKENSAQDSDSPKTAIEELRESCNKGNKDACSAAKKLTATSQSLKKSSNTLKKKVKDTWVLYKPEKGFFSVKFPTKPVPQEKIISKHGVKTKMYMALSQPKNAVLIASYTNYNTINSNLTISPKDMLTSMKVGFDKNPKYQVTKDKFFIFNGIQGIDMDVTMAGQKGRCVILYKGGHSYQMLTLNDSSNIMTNRFFKSFKLLKPIVVKEIKITWHKFKSKKHRYSLKLPCKAKRMKKGTMKIKNIKVMESFMCTDKKSQIYSGGLIGKFTKRRRNVKNKIILDGSINRVLIDMKAKLISSYYLRKGKYHGRCADIKIAKDNITGTVCTFVKKKNLRTFNFLHNSGERYKNHSKKFIKSIKLR
jgi:hypothetical protein